MNYWLTTHWPRQVGDSSTQSGVWVQDGHESVIAQVKKGDYVVLYESAGGKTIKSVRADGTVDLYPPQPGRQGVIALHSVTGEAREPPDSEPEHYADGTSKWWRWHAPTKPITTAGFIPRPRIAELMDFAKAYGFRAIGEQNSGLKKITESRFDAIREEFIRSHKQRDKKRHSGATGRSDGGGEGPVHRALKEAIAADPTLFGEVGLTLVKVEFPFPTGDRIDVVLNDRFGRFVAVEVEVDCDRSEIAGPLQCIKYRSLLAYWFGRPEREVRSILAAHTIHKDLISKLGKYGVECQIIGRELVSA